MEDRLGQNESLLIFDTKIKEEGASTQGQNTNPRVVTLILQANYFSPEHEIWNGVTPTSQEDVRVNEMGKYSVCLKYSLKIAEHMNMKMAK